MTEMSGTQHAPARDERTAGQRKRDELKARALEGLREHGTIGHAAAAAGVSPRTLYRWRDADPEFDAQVREWMHVDQVDQLHASLYSRAMDMDPKTASAGVKAAEILLKALDPATYGDKLKVESEQTINHQIQVVHEVRDQHRQMQQERLRRLAERTIEAEPVQQATTAESQKWPAHPGHQKEATARPHKRTAPTP